MKPTKLIRRFWILYFEIAVFALFCAVAADALAADVTLAWNPNPESNLAGYRLHYGTTNGSYSVHIDVQNVTRYTVTGLTAGQIYYFAATAYNTSGHESGYSSSVSYTAPAVNGAPFIPAPPSGPASALVNTAVTFSTLTTDPNGDSLQYRYDWGGGVLSAWGAASQSRSWAATGQFAVRAQAQDSLGAQSGWSSAKTVTITQSTAPAVVDTDGDGVPDSNDAFPNDPQEWADVNGNGVGDNANAAATAANASAQAPAAPSLVSPANDAVVSAMPVLKTGDYRSAAHGTSHAKTRWQIFRDEDDACVLDILSTAALTGFTVPKLVLDGKTPYFWRAQFIDQKGASSAWSNYEYFSTAATAADRNANGIPDAQEVSWKTDLNRDGIRDYRQTTIKSVKVSGTNAQVGVSIKGSPTALAIEAVESGGPYQSSSSYPGINYKIAAAKPGDRMTVTIHFSAAATSGSKWYAYATAPGKWTDFSSYVKFAADGRSLLLSFTDGGPGDADGVVNGVIVHTGTFFVQ